MSVLVLTVGSVAAPTTLSTPTNLTATPNSDGTANLLACDAVTHADQYLWEKQVDSTGVWSALATTASPTFNDNGITAGHHRLYRVKAGNSTGAYITSAYATSGDIFTAVTSGGWPVLRESIIPGAPAAGGMESEWGFKAGTTAVYLEVNTTSNAKFASLLGFTAVPGFLRTWTCTLRDAAEITQTLVIALGGSVGSPVVVYFTTSGAMAPHASGDITTTYPGMVFLFQTAPAPGFFTTRINWRIAASDVLRWHWQNIQGNGLQTNPLVDNADGSQIGAASFTAPSIFRSGDANCSYTGSCDEGCEIYSPGTSVFSWQCANVFPLSLGKGTGEHHACYFVFGEIPTSAAALRFFSGDADFRDPALCRIPLLTMADGFAGNSSFQWVNVNPNNRANGGFGPNQQQLYNFVNILFQQGPNSTTFEPIQMNEYVSGGPATVVAGSKICVKDLTVEGAGFTGHGVSDSDSKSFCFEYNNGPYGSGSVTTGANAAFYTTTIITAAWPGNYVSRAKPTTAAEKRAFIALLKDTCGARPADRSVGYDETFMQQFLNQHDGVSSGVGAPAIVNALSEIHGATGNGYPTVAVNARNVYTGTHPRPVDPDTLVTYGTRQLKKIAVWAIEESNRVSIVVQPSLID